MKVDSDYGSTRYAVPAPTQADRRRDARVERILARSEVDVATQGTVQVRDAKHAVEMLGQLPLRAQRHLERAGGSVLLVGREVHLADTPPFAEFTRDQVPRRGAAWAGVAVFDANASRTGYGHASEQGVLHEVGHVLDATMGLDRPPADPRAPWRDRAAWASAEDGFDTDDIRLDGELQRQHFAGTEWFAEAFAMYSASPASHARLEQGAPATFEYMERTFGAPRFDPEN